MSELSDRLQVLRIQSNLTQEQAAKLLEMTGGGYANYEHAFSLPNTGGFVRLAEIYHTSVQYIIKGEELSAEFKEGKNTPFAQRLRELRKKHGMTQQKIASFLGVRRVTYHGYEHEKYEPKLEKLLQLAELFGVTLDELMGRNPK